MKIAVLSDIHGNETALRRCLDDARAEGAERYIFLGDYAGELPWPEHTMDMLYDLAARFPCVFIRGNKEDYWLNADPAWRCGDPGAGMLWYNVRHMRERDGDFYRSLPYSRVLRLPGLPPVTLCHGTPGNAREKMLPDHAATRAVMEHDVSRLILCGHSHVQAEISHDGRLAVNPGSVGVPLGSGGQTQYMLLTGEHGAWTYRLITLPYDVEAAVESLRRADLYAVAPAWTRVTAYVLRHGDISHADVLDRAMEICRRETGDCQWPFIPERCWQEAMDELMT